MIKNFVFILIFALCYVESFSQSKYGVDSVSCITNLSLFREYYKQKNYIEALTPWRWTFQNCPKASGNIYKNGPIIIKSLIKERPEQKKEYVDTLMLIYDQRIKYFGKVEKIFKKISNSGINIKNINNEWVVKIN